MSKTSHWQNYHTRWAKLRAPLRPNDEIIDKVVDLVGDRDGRVLLLGVTPELAAAFETVVAVDKSAAMIANIWPGNSATKTAIEADWLEIGQSLGEFSAVVGDGSCNAVTDLSEVRRLLENVRDCLAPGGLFICRVYERPLVVPALADLAAAASRPATRNFHAFKWQLAMRIAEDSEPSVPVERILRTFNDLFPNREALANRSGWSRSDIDTIDTYRGSQTIYCFPNRAEILASIPNGLEQVRFHTTGTYDLAECCPIISCHRT